MSWKIGMPNLGHTMEEGRVAEWLNSVGDTVEKGQVIATIETDKATFDVEAPATGVLLAIDVPAGTVVAIGTTIGVVGDADELVQAHSAAPSSTMAVHSAPQPTPAVAAPSERRAAKVSPAARALAVELGVDLAGIEGTGEGGIVTRDDVRSAASASAVVAFSPMRRAIADATAAAWRAVPHVTLLRHANVDALLKHGAPGITAAIVRAAGLALGQHRSFNGWLIDGAFHQGPHIDIGVAVSVSGGLMMPVIRQADRSDVGKALDDLAARARSGSLEGSETTGATFSVSSLGRWGVEAFTPIINAPEVAILGVGKIDRIAREAPDGSIRFASEVQLSLVFDHRANDGVAAAKLLAEIADNLSQPARLEMIDG